MDRYDYGNQLSSFVEVMLENYIAYFRLFAVLEPMMMRESADVTWFVAPTAPGQHVLRTRITTPEPQRRIAEILQEVGQYTREMRWLVAPGSEPAALGTLLEEQGLRFRRGDVWMLADLSRPMQTAALPAGFSIRPVRDEGALRVWTAVSAAGFGISEEMAEVWYEAYVRDGFGPEATARHFTGYWEERPVCSSTLLLGAGMAGVFDVSTAPEFRRRGFGRAITAVAMEAARQAGYRWACLQASVAGMGIYEQLGFEVQFQEEAYYWKRPVGEEQQIGEGAAEAH